MEKVKVIKNWKGIINLIGVTQALDILKTQTYPAFNVERGTYAIKSEASGRMLVCYNTELTLNANEILGTWTILIPDTDKEEKLEEVRKLMKDSNASGLSYPHIDNMNINQIWERVSYLISLDETQMYKMLKHYYKENVYKK